MSADNEAGGEGQANRKVSLSFIMPVFNEEESIGPALARVTESLDKLCSEYEVIVIDDYSSDQTGAIAAAFAEREPKVRILRNERNLNYGTSLIRGIAAAKFEWLLHNGVDLPLAPEDMQPFFDVLGEADVVVAARESREAHSPWRKLTSVTNRGLLGILFAPVVTDLNFTQFYRRSVATSFRLIANSPVVVTPELILRSEKCGYRVLEIVIPFRRREAGKTHFGRPKDILWTLRDLIRLRVVTWIKGWN
jgi:glycosyltransferase involved in cell wall biosynthesis